MSVITDGRDASLVCVVILDYNKANYFRQALPSVAAGAFKSREIIVADGGWTDDNAEVIINRSDVDSIVVMR